MLDLELNRTRVEGIQALLTELEQFAEAAPLDSDKIGEVVTSHLKKLHDAKISLMNIMCMDKKSKAYQRQTKEYKAGVAQLSGQSPDLLGQVLHLIKEFTELQEVIEITTKVGEKILRKDDSVADEEEEFIRIMEEHRQSRSPSPPLSNSSSDV